MRSGKILSQEQHVHLTYGTSAAPNVPLPAVFPVRRASALCMRDAWVVLSLSFVWKLSVTLYVCSPTNGLFFHVSVRNRDIKSFHLHETFCTPHESLHRKFLRFICNCVAHESSEPNRAWQDCGFDRIQNDRSPVLSVLHSSLETVISHYSQPTMNGNLPKQEWNWTAIVLSGGSKKQEEVLLYFFTTTWSKWLQNKTIFTQKVLMILFGMTKCFDRNRITERNFSVEQFVCVCVCVCVWSLSVSLSLSLSLSLGVSSSKAVRTSHCLQGYSAVHG